MNVNPQKTIEAYPAANCSAASAGFTERNSSYFLIRSLIPLQGIGELSRVAAGNALAIAVHKVFELNVYGKQLIFRGAAPITVRNYQCEATTECYLYEGSGCFFHGKLIAPVFLRGRGLLPPRKAKHGVGSCWRERFK